MKTLGRVLMILIAFVLIMGITYVVVKAVNGTNFSTTAPRFEGREGFPQLDRENGERPEFERGERGEFGGGWMFGMLKNITIVGIIVALIAVPRSLMRRKPTAVQIAENR